MAINLHFETEIKSYVVKIVDNCVACFMAIKGRPGIRDLILAIVFIFEELTNSFFELVCVSHEIYAFVLKYFSLIKAMLMMKVMSKICSVILAFIHLVT